MVSKYFKVAYVFLVVSLLFSSVLANGGETTLIKDFCGGDSTLCTIISPIIQALVNIYHGIRTDSPAVNSIFMIIMFVCLVPVYYKLLESAPPFKNKKSHRARNSLAIILSLFTVAGLLRFVPNDSPFLGYIGAVVFYIFIVCVCISLYVFACMFIYRSLWDDDDTQKKWAVSLLFSFGFVLVSVAIDGVYKRLSGGEVGAVQTLIEHINSTISFIGEIAYIIFFVSLTVFIFILLGKSVKKPKESEEEEDERERQIQMREEINKENKRLGELISLLKYGTDSLERLSSEVVSMHNKIINLCEGKIESLNKSLSKEKGGDINFFYNISPNDNSVRDWISGLEELSSNFRKLSFASLKSLDKIKSITKKGVKDEMLEVFKSDKKKLLELINKSEDIKSANLTNKKEDPDREINAQLVSQLSNFFESFSYDTDNFNQIISDLEQLLDYGSFKPDIDNIIALLSNFKMCEANSDEFENKKQMFDAVVQLYGIISFKFGEIINRCMRILNR